MSSDYEPLRVEIQKFRGNKEGIADLLDDLKNIVDKVPNKPMFVFKCELKEEAVS